MNPRTKIGNCPYCKGTGKRKGWLFTHSCIMCQGSGAAHMDITVNMCLCGWQPDPPSYHLINGRVEARLPDYRLAQHLLDEKYKAYGL